MSEDEEKSALAEETFAAFCGEFGEDIYSAIMLEVLLEGVMNEEAVFIFGKQEQEGDQGDYGPSGGVDCDKQVDGPIDPEAPPDMGEEDCPDHQRPQDAL